MSVANVGGASTRPAGAVIGLLVLAISLSGGRPAVSAEEDASENAVRATAAMELARHRYGDGRYKEAAALFHEAYKIDPRPEYLYNAARAEQRGFLNDTALRTYDRLLALPGLTADVRRRAEGHRREIVELRSHMKKTVSAAPAAPLPKAATPATAAAAPAKVPPSDPGAVIGANGPQSPSQWPAWTALGGGTALVAVAAVLAVMAADARDDLDAKLALEDGYVTGAISHEQARSDADRIALQRNGALAAGAIGATLVGTGIWLLLREPPKVALSLCPSRRCAALAVRF